MAPYSTLWIVALIGICAGLHPGSVAEVQPAASPICRQVLVGPPVVLKVAARLRHGGRRGHVEFVVTVVQVWPLSRFEVNCQPLTNGFLYQLNILSGPL